jgi:lipopolysaccharide export system protein LptA
MRGRDIDLRYGPDGQTLEYARAMGEAAIEMAGDAGGEGRRITAADLELEMAPDGVTPTDLAARGKVELRLPTDRGAARVIQAATLDADGDAQGLTSARFAGGVEFREVGRDLDRRAASRTLEAELAPGLGAISEAEFEGGVRFVDGATLARAATARYGLDAGVITLSGSVNGAPPNVTRDRISIDGARIQVTLAGPLIDATGAVRSALQPAKRAADEPAAVAGARMPSMLREDQAVNVSADRVVYDGVAKSATYTGSAQLWQAETTIKGDSIVVDEASGDLTARGAPVATTAVLMQPAPAGTTERVRTIASARAAEFLYEESLRRATYVGDAFVSGPQGDVRGDRIELYLLPSGDELERAEAYDNVTLEESTRRRASGARMTYFAADERYVMTGAPVTIVDECGRETSGGTLTFYKTVDRIVVDGGPVRSRTKGGGDCP